MRISFYNSNDNYKEALLLNNPCIKRGRHDTGLLSVNFFNQNPAITRANLVKLKFSDVWGEEGIFTLDEINRRTTLNLNLLTYMRLGAALNFYRVQLGANRISDGSKLSLENFLLRFKKGSKPIRMTMQKCRKIKPINDRTHIKTLLRITSCVGIEVRHLKNSQEFWSYPFLPNYIREFILKFNSNLLGINTRVFNFVENHSRACSFCELKKINPAPDETFIHLFYECDTTCSYFQYFENLLFPEKDFNLGDTRKRLWFFGILEDTSLKNNLFTGTCLWVLKYLIWEAKLKKKTPPNIAIKKDFFYIMGGIFDTSHKVRHDKNLQNFSICRNWELLRRC